MSKKGRKLNLSAEERARRADVMRKLRPLYHPALPRPLDEELLANKEARKRYDQTEKSQQTLLNYRRKNIDKIRQWNRVSAERKRSRDPYAYAAWMFSVTRDDIISLYETHGYLCAICRQPERTISNKSGKVRRLPIDHDHARNKIRGILCSGCNQAIGLMEEDTSRLRAAALYLESHSGNYDFDGHA